MTEPTIVELLDRERARHEQAVKAVRRARAELEVLEVLDQRRAAAGHDYGSGQRGKELQRRHRELARLEADAGHPWYLSDPPELGRTAEDLEAALERIVTPRERRLEREDFRRRTPSTRRTADALAGTRRVIAGRVHVARETAA